MLKTIPLGLLIALAVGIASAKTQVIVKKIHPSLPPFELRIHKVAAAKSDWFYSIDWIEVRRAGRPRQKIRFESEDVQPAVPSWQKQPVSFQDIDCDGYKDLMVLKSVGVGANAWYYLYRFDPASGMFKEYKPFQGLPFRSVNCNAKTVTTYVNSGAAGCNFEAAEYRWSDETLKAVRKESQESGADDDGYFRRIVTTWKNGRKTEITRKIPEDDCHQP